MASPGSEFEDDDNAPDTSQNPSHFELLRTSRSEFEDNSTEQHPPAVTATIQSAADIIPNGEQSQANSLDGQENSAPSTISSVSEAPEITGPLRFERLPDKVVVKILRLVPREELEDLKTVSSQFRMLIDGQIGLSITIGSITDSLVVDGSIEKLKEVGISSCTIINIINTRVPDKPYRYPQLLRSLTLRGYISEKNFLRLISTTPFVEKLQVDVSTLSVVEFQDINLQEHFPNLSTLKITCERDFFSDCTSTQWLTACYSLVGLLKGKHSNLKQFNISIPFISTFRELTCNFPKELFTFLQRHGSTLNRLKVEYGGFYEDIDEDDDNDEPETEFYSQEIKLQNLEYFALSLVIDEDDAGLPRNPGAWVEKLNEQWLPIISCQKHLQSCTVHHSVFFPSPIIATICSYNKLTLNTLHWKFQKQDSNGTRVAVDCVIFQDCTSLLELVVSGPTEEDLPFFGDDQAWWSRPKFFNLNKLPDSLEKLKMDFCEVATSEFTCLPLGFPNLKCLSLDTNCHDPNGLSVETLTGLLEKESLKLLIVQKSFNSKSLYINTNIEGSSSVVSIIRALLSAWRLNTPLSAMATFALRRNANGQWENAGGAIPNIRRNMFPTPVPEGLRAMAVFPLMEPLHQRRVMFDL